MVCCCPRAVRFYGMGGPRWFVISLPRSSAFQSLNRSSAFQSVERLPAGRLEGARAIQGGKQRLCVTFTNFALDIHAHATLAAAAGPSLMLTPLAAAAGPSLMWPYTMGGPGCALCCGRPPLVVLTMVGAGLGLPLSEELLVLGIGAALPGLSNTRRLCTLVWLLVGVVASDLATVGLGTLLRRNSASLRAQAPRFGGRLLASVGQQLSVEGRRDARRLERQLSYRLQSTARSAAELLALLSRAAEQPGAGEPPPPLPPLPGPLQLTLLRRATCNTRTALATAGQVRWPEPELVRTPEPELLKARAVKSPSC